MTTQSEKKNTFAGPGNVICSSETAVLDQQTAHIKLGALFDRAMDPEIEGLFDTNIWEEDTLEKYMIYTDYDLMHKTCNIFMYQYIYIRISYICVIHSVILWIIFKVFLIVPA